MIKQDIEITVVKTIFSRHKDNYDFDVKLKKLKRKTGIASECTFYVIPSYQVVIDSSVGIGHDIFQGVFSYELAEVLHELVAEKKIIEFDIYNEIGNFSFSENSCKPKPLSLDNIKKSALNVQL